MTRGWGGLHARPGVGLLPIHRQAGISRHPTAGGHEGPPVHPPPPSPLLTFIGFSFNWFFDVQVPPFTTRALIDRNNELLRPLKEFQEICCCGFHMFPFQYEYLTPLHPPLPK